MQPAEVRAYQEDEIDLIDLFKNIWQQRGLIIGVMLACFSLVLSYHFAKASFLINKKVEYSISVVLADEQSRYPNGSLFSPLDIISERSLQDVAKQYDLNVRKLSSALRSDYSNSLLMQAEKKLGEYLGDSKSPADVIAAAEKTLGDLRKLSRKSITISLDTEEAGVKETLINSRDRSPPLVK